MRIGCPTMTLDFSADGQQHVVLLDVRQRRARTTFGRRHMSIRPFASQLMSVNSVMT